MTDAFRIVTLALLAVATGAIVRFVYSTPRPVVPWWLLPALILSTLAMSGQLVINTVAEPEVPISWWVTPPALGFSLVVLYGLRHTLRWRTP